MLLSASVSGRMRLGAEIAGRKGSGWWTDGDRLFRTGGGKEETTTMVRIPPFIVSFLLTVTDR